MRIRYLVRGMEAIIATYTPYSDPPGCGDPKDRALPDPVNQQPSTLQRDPTVRVGGPLVLW